MRTLLLTSALILILAIWAMVSDTIREYNRSYDQAKREASRLATILSDQVGQKLTAVDLLLQHAVERQHLNLLFGGKLPQDIAHNFRLWIEGAPQIGAISLINERGWTEVGISSRRFHRWMDYSKPFDEFLPFILLKAEDAPSQVVMPYTTKGESKLEVILVARRINKLDGTFGGMVMAAVDAEFFLNYFTVVDTVRQRYIDVVMDDGRSIFADSPHERLWKERSLAWPSLQIMINKNQHDTLVFQSAEGDRRVVGYHTLSHLPLTALVAVDEDSFMEEFWEDRYKDFSFLLLMVLFGAVGSFFMVVMAKQVALVEKSEASAILASQAKSEFLANMSHELRTPLNAIIGFSEMMTAGYFGPLNAKQKERVADISLCGNHLLHLINDILEFSKGEAGRLEIIEEKVGVASVIDEAIRIMNERIKTKGIKLVVEVQAGMPELFADKRKIKQVLINLVSNAVKFTPADGKVTVRAFMDHNRDMVMEVSDTGIGIAEEDIPTALAVFGQVHRSQSHEGTGLGLPLCRMFTELHGGSLTLSSVLGEGTTVRLSFPQSRVIVEE